MLHFKQDSHEIDRNINIKYTIYSHLVWLGRLAINCRFAHIKSSYKLDKFI